MKRLLLLLMLLPAVYATSVTPPSFDELVGQADLVFRGKVTAVQCGWQGEGAQRHIATQVTLEVEKPLKGEPPATLTLEFMGGEIGGRQLKVLGMPEFAAGQRGIYFIQNRAGRFCPIMRLRYGRYPIPPAGTQGVERVVRDDNQPLTDVSAVGEPLIDAPVRSAAEVGGMTLADFEQRIVKRAAELAQGTKAAQ